VPARTLAPGREEGKEDKGDALPTRRRRRRWTMDGKWSLSPRAAPSSPHANTRCAAASPPLGHQVRIRTYEGPSLFRAKGKKARIDLFSFWAVSNRTVILGPTWFRTGPCRSGWIRSRSEPFRAKTNEPLNILRSKMCDLVV
jgi:hypothetical protein